MNRTAFPLRNPTEHWSAAAFVRKPQIDLFTPTLHHSITPAQSSLIVPFSRASTWLPTPKPRNLAIARWRDPTDPTDPDRSVRSGNPKLAAPSGHAKALAKAEAERRRVKASQTSSKPVKVFCHRHRQATVPAAIAIYCGFPGQTRNKLCFAACGLNQSHLSSRNSRQTPSNRVKPRQTGPTLVVSPSNQGQSRQIKANQGQSRQNGVFS